METVSLLALDLGTHTGWAYAPTPGMIMYGSWDLSPGRGGEGLRYQRMTSELDRFWSQHELRFPTKKLTPPLEVLYEQVHRHAGTRACHVYGGLLAHLQVWCLNHQIVATPVGVGQIKKFWTGRGNATKDDMVAEARARGFDPVDDNEADALALLHRRIIEGPGGEKENSAGRHAYRLARSLKEIEGRSVARRATRRLRAGDRDLPEGGGEHPEADR